MRIKYPFDEKVMAEQAKLAQANEQNASREMRNFRRSIQETYGYEIKLETAPAGVLPKTTTVWDQEPPVNYHTVRLAASPPAELMRSARIIEAYLRGQALMKIENECAAHAAGARKTYVMTSETAGNLRGLCESWLKEEVAKGRNEQELRKVVSSAVIGLSHSVNSYPTKMLIDMELKRRFPILHPAQFVRENLWELHGFNDPAKVVLPVPLALPLKALHAAHRRFLDEVLFSGATSHFAPSRGTEVGDLAERLFQAAKAQYTTLTPGCHYELMDQFTQIVGFPDMIRWENRSCHEYRAESATLN